MAFTEPVLTKRIPLDPSQRKTYWYDDYVATGGYESLKKAMTMTPEEIIKLVTDSGLRGRGGAGFSAGQKWSFIPKEKKVSHYLAVNADESEPGTFKDRYLINYDPHQLLEGIAIAARATQCDIAYIYIRGEYHLQAKILDRAIAEAYDKGIFGTVGVLGGERKLECYVHRGAGAYICGEETGLLESLEGKRGWPRNKPPFPAIAGAFARPTVINNVETLCCVPRILERGGEWFKTMGTKSSPGPKLYGMSGHLNRPGVYEQELGITLDFAINELGGGMKGGKFKASICGGISMGVLGTHQLDIKLDFDDVRFRGGCLGLGTAGDDRHERTHRHGRCPAQLRPLLCPRILRAMHALPRRLGLDAKNSRPHRRWRRPNHRFGNVDGIGKDHGHHARHHHLRPRRRHRLGHPHFH